MIKNITVLVDNDSWIIPYASLLVKKLNDEGLSATFASNHEEVNEGDVCFFLGCTKIANSSLLGKNKHNLVVHESSLPQGKGFAPVAWQILENKNNISVCLIEAEGDVDSGGIWLTDVIELDGTELSNEWREKQGNISISLALSFVHKYDSLKVKKQEGNSSFYRRRNPKDSEISADSSLAEQFNLLRVVSNDNYPAFFYHKDQKYILNITKADD